MEVTSEGKATKQGCTTRLQGKAQEQRGQARLFIQMSARIKAWLSGRVTEPCCQGRALVQTPQSKATRQSDEVTLKKKKEEEEEKKNGYEGTFTGPD